MSEQYYIEGKFLRELFHNADNSFSIIHFLVSSTDTPDDILADALDSEGTEKDQDDFCGRTTVSGYFPRMDRSQSYEFKGKWSNHPKYGFQFQVASFRKVEGFKTSSDVVLYLSSDTFKGIGKKTAQLVVDTLGEDAISKILDDRKTLNQVQMTHKQRNLLYEMLVASQGDDKVLTPLYGLGMAPSLVMKVFKTYGKRALSVIHQDPYQLIAEIEGIGFVGVDEIASKLGISTADTRRIRAVLMHVLGEMAYRSGHTYLMRAQLMQSVLKFLQGDVEEDVVAGELRELLRLKHVVEDEGRFYLAALFNCERKVALSVKHLQSGEAMSDKRVVKAFDVVKKKLDITYSDMQTQAILTSLREPFSIITGGPGTGKTTIVKGILMVYEQICRSEKRDPVILLASPTGRAAKRMNETTQMEASTIHRMLGYDRSKTFKYNEENPLEADLIIVDEVSMLDTYLAFQLFTSIKKDTKVILVGDDNQLPSVGPGQVLRDLIESESVTLTRLTEIHRQAEGSSVIALAHEINLGRLPGDLGEKKEDRLFIPATDNEIIAMLERVIQNAVSKGYTASDVQVLIPMYRGHVGIDRVNQLLQKLFNPPAEEKVELENGARIFREGDKVLQLANNPDEGIMNGDVGEVISIETVPDGKNNEKQIIVKFDHLRVEYRRDDFISLTHAYAMSIHKSQGSEYKVVIMPMSQSYYFMLQKKLLYTGVTRAQKSLVIIGDHTALKRCVENDGDGRQTGLKNILQRAASPSGKQALEPNDALNNSDAPGANDGDENLHQEYFALHNIPFATLDEVRLEGITPYDYM